MLDYKTLAEKFKAYIETPIGKKEFQDYFDKLNNEAIIHSNHIDRLHNDFYSKELVNKIISKYKSDDYYNRWIKRSIEPPCDLFWLLFDHAKVYGEDSYHKVINGYFTTESYDYDGFRYERLDGQGSVIIITELK